MRASAVRLKKAATAQAKNKNNCYKIPAYFFDNIRHKYKAIAFFMF